MYMQSWKKIGKNILKFVYFSRLWIWTVKDYGDTAQMGRLWAFAGQICIKYRLLMGWLIWVVTQEKGNSTVCAIIVPVRMLGPWTRLEI